MYINIGDAGGPLVGQLPVAMLLISSLHHSCNSLFHFSQLSLPCTRGCDSAMLTYIFDCTVVITKLEQQ